MILVWMLIALFVGVAAGVAALALDSASRAMRRPTRWPWVGALALSTLWPAWLGLSSAAAFADHGRIGTVTLPPVLLMASRAAITQVTHRLGHLDERTQAAVVVLWLVVSAALLLRLMLGMRFLNQQR